MSRRGYALSCGADTVPERRDLLSRGGDALPAFGNQVPGGGDTLSAGPDAMPAVTNTLSGGLQYLSGARSDHDRGIPICARCGTSLSGAEFTLPGVRRRICEGNGRAAILQSAGQNAANACGAPASFLA